MCLYCMLLLMRVLLELFSCAFLGLCLFSFLSEQVPFALKSQKVLQLKVERERKKKKKHVKNFLLHG
ncbi:hypothetical protein PRUPE_1G366400 [Prunus persica]|uniref:Uncharacterized protein n=1 Tax=Prunus persica TaxID=3760 RepID=A0A251R8P9_PRUPE|nr:hypothetical protein PRUPE_1G366400 [Prunus persica]